MKTKCIYFLLTIVFFCGVVFSVFRTEKFTYKFRAQGTIRQSDNEESEEQGIKGAMDWWARRTVNHLTGKIDPNDVMQAEAEVKALRDQKNTNTNPMNWIEMGPDNVGGRTRAMLIDKDNNNIIYAGGVSGGLWRSVTGGLSWNKVPYTGDDLSAFQDLVVASICQAANGDMYFGTGEIVSGNPYVEAAHGQGIWKSTKATDPDHNNFVRVHSTWTSNVQSIFNYVSKLAADPVNPLRIYASTSKGLQTTDDGGDTWYLPTGIISSVSTDVKVGSDGSVVCSIADKTYISTDGGATFQHNYTLWPNSTSGRLEFAIAPSDPNYIYCQAAKPNGNLLNIYQSKDKGQTWTVIGPGVGPNGENSDFNPLGDQGTYDNVIAVAPDDREFVIVGGQSNMWKWQNYQWSQISSGGYFYVHSDHHAIVFYPDFHNNHTIYFGTDGGIFKTTDAGDTFSDLNRNYNTVQFYAIGHDGVGHVIGGTQDNGTLYIGFTGNTLQNSVAVKGGDGGYCEISLLDPNITFATTYYGSLMRSQTKGSSLDGGTNPVGQYFFNNRILNQYWNGLTGNIGINYSNAASFVTPIRLWESFNDALSTDTALFINTIPDLLIDNWLTFNASYISKFTNIQVDTTMVQNAQHEYVVSTRITYFAGQTITAKSEINSNPLPYTLTSTLHPGDTVKVKDVYQAVFAMGFNGNVWITRKPLNFKLASTTFPWYPIVKPSLSIGLVEELEFSKDGNYLFFAAGNNLYRAANLLFARTDTAMSGSMTLTPTVDNANQVIDVKLIKTFNSNITGIATDPTDPDNVIVTLGEFGSSDYVMYSTNAVTVVSPTFVSKQGNLPRMPVYSSIIGWDSNIRVVVGTEYGIYRTEDITASPCVWSDENSNGMQNVQVCCLRQQTFPNNWLHNIYNTHGVIYAGTHGRGIFRCEDFKGPLDVPEIPEATVSKSSIIVYPNPAVDLANVSFRLIKQSDVTINVFDLQGKLVKTEIYGSMSSGTHKLSVNVNGLSKGSYIMSINTGYNKLSSKFMVQ
ncbi:MAG: T9SS type A sorting domain-containing protein [Bacteroidia bacterium]|nr:T9SS type A sorting domain-containing protein [Bacteroidia bacterium]